MNAISPPTPAKSHRLWIPLLIVVLIGGVVGFLRWKPELDRNLRDWASTILPLFGTVLLVLWYVLLSRYSGRARLAGLALAVLVVVGLKVFVRFDGTMDGRGLPRLAWRWSKKAVRELPKVAAGAAVAAAEGAMDVPQFFGPNRDGKAPAVTLVPDWKATPPKELWRQAIGTGWSAFAVAGGRAFTQEQRGEEECVTCYELMSGRLLWTHANAARFEQWQAGEGPHATPTLDTATGLLYALGGTGILDCLKADTGEKVWSHNVLQENSLNNQEWGISSSPLLVGDLVIVTGGQTGDGKTNGPVLFAYKKPDGAQAWKAGNDTSSYTSPSLATLCGKSVVLVVNGTNFNAHDPVTGAVLLSYTWGGDKWPKAAQPVVLDGDQVFLSAGYGMGCSLLKVTAAADGKLEATEVWKSLKMKTQFNSVAERSGHLYGLDDGKLSCMNVATGERLWKDGRFGSGQSLLVGDLIITQAEAGDVVLAGAKPAGYEELGRVKALTSKTWNHPVLAGKYLLVRNDREAVCYEVAVK